MTQRQEQQICRLYYLDGRSVQDIAKELKVSRDAVRAAVDDPTAQAEYLAMAEQVRKRLRVRQGFAAEAAMEKQLQILQAEASTEAERQQQLLTAERILRRADAADQREAASGKKEIVFRIDGIELGMPPPDGDRKRALDPDQDDYRGRMNK